MLAVCASLERELQGREAALLGAKAVLVEAIVASTHEDAEDAAEQGSSPQEWVQRAVQRAETRRAGGAGAGWLDVCGVFVRDGASAGAPGGVVAYSGALALRWGWDEAAWERCVAVLASR